MIEAMFKRKTNEPNKAFATIAITTPETISPTDLSKPCLLDAFRDNIISHNK